MTSNMLKQHTEPRWQPGDTASPSSTTQLVNVKVKFIRPEFDHLEEWMNHPDHVYIGRNGRVFIGSKEDRRIFHYPSSKWKNPFPVGSGKGKYSREESLLEYRNYIEKQIETNRETYDLEELRGKKLGCWCHPEGCHGQVLIDLLSHYEK